MTYTAFRRPDGKLDLYEGQLEARPRSEEGYCGTGTDAELPALGLEVSVRG
jgi:hypothetical protein